MPKTLIEKSTMELYQEAGSLNNKLDTNVDMVTIMGFMSHDECVKHVETLRQRLFANKLEVELAHCNNWK